MPIPLHFQLEMLPLKSVHLHCLDPSGTPIPGTYASGFLCRENDGFYLYTSWHLVTGFNKHEVKVPIVVQPLRAFLQVSLQNAQVHQPGVTVIGGKQSLVLPLYDTSESPPLPLWSQDEADIPHAGLNAMGLRVPFWHDAIKLRLPLEVRLADFQAVEIAATIDSPVAIGEKVFVVGYPYGFSPEGAEQPTAIVLTRFIAATRVAGRTQEILMEGFGAHGMSGGPVFIERDSNLLLVGLYTGLLYPDHVIKHSDPTTALGTCCNMMLAWTHLPLVPYPALS